MSWLLEIFNPQETSVGDKPVEERILSSLVTRELSSAELAVAIGQHSLSGKLYTFYSANICVYSVTRRFCVKTFSCVLCIPWLS